MVKRVLLACLLLLPFPFTGAGAQDKAPAEQPRSEFFSGVITEFGADRITVFKTVLGKNSETRTFTITKDTRVEGKLRMKARVTVRYVRDDEGDRAQHIIVRASPKK